MSGIWRKLGRLPCLGRISWQKSRSLASAWRRLSLSGSKNPVRSQAGAQLRSPIRIILSLLEIIFDLPFGFPINNIISLILSLGCFSTHAAMIFPTSCCSTGLAAVNWYKSIMTNLPPLLVVVDRANALALTTGWRPFPRRSCRPG